MNQIEHLAAQASNLEWQGNPLRHGLRLLQDTIKPAYQQTSADLTIFAEQRQQPLVYNWQENVIDATPHFYDKRAAYLSACSMTALGVGELIRFDNQFLYSALAARMPGIWHISSWSSDANSLPAHFIFSSPASWEYTPTISVARAAGYHLRFSEAYLFPEYHYLFRPFYERMKLARKRLLALTDNALQEECLNLWKQVYVQALGCLAHRPEHAPQGKLYRPDWYSLLRAQARAALVYNILGVWRVEGQQPACVNTDCIGYMQPVTTLRVGNDIGMYRVVNET
jgi:hypothetical protein